MLPSAVPAAVLMQLASGAPASPNPPAPLPGPLRQPRGRRIELPSPALDMRLHALSEDAPHLTHHAPCRLH